MSLQQEIRTAEEYLEKCDPDLAELIARQKPLLHEGSDDYFSSLARSIIGQQVSVAAASAIFGRFADVTQLQPLKALHLTNEQIRLIGLSRQKSSYIRDLAQHFTNDPKVYTHLEKADDDTIISELTAIKGVGVWTAQMFLMFTLLRLDVFAPDDAGLQRAMRALYGWEITPKKATLEHVAERWRPYRSVACWHLWQSLHNTPM